MASSHPGGKNLKTHSVPTMARDAPRHPDKTQMPSSVAFSTKNLKPSKVGDERSHELYVHSYYFLIPYILKVPQKRQGH